MKIIKINMAFWALLLSFCQSAITQNYYIPKTDASGANNSSYIASLENASQSLSSAFPSPFNAQFKVFEFGYYLHNQNQANAIGDVWSEMIQEVSQESPYYLLIGKEISSEEVISRFRVDLKLPSTGDFDCINENRLNSINLQIESAINQYYSGQGNFPDSYAESEIVGIDSLKSIILKYIDCCLCCQNKPESSSSCTPCIDSNDGMAAHLKSMGFAEYVGAVITLTQQPYILPLNSDYKIDLQIEGKAIQFTEDLYQFLLEASYFGATQARVKVYNESNCNEFSLFTPLSSSGTVYTEDIVVIDKEGEKRIFYKVTTTLYGQQNAIRSGDHAEMPIPIIAVWLLKRAAMAAVSVATHILTETALEYFFGDHADIWAAWDAVDLDWWEVLEAGAEGIIGANNIKVQMLLGACRQTIDYLIETPYDQIDAGAIFSAVFFGALTGALNHYIDSGTEKFQGLLNKYGPKIAAKSFKKLGVHELFFKFKSFRRTYINIVWSKAQPLDRGWLIEEALQFGAYKGWDRIGDANGPADFLVNGWASQVKSIEAVDPVKNWSNIKSHLDKGCDRLIDCLTLPNYAQYNVANLRLDIVIPSSQSGHYNALLQKVRTYISNKYPNNFHIQQMLNDQMVIIGTFLD